MPRISILFILLFTTTIGLCEKDTGNEWLTNGLYGHDNGYAALKKVRIFKVDSGYRVYIQNQFKFECKLTLDANGNPSLMSGCKSKEEPRPVCRDIHNPDSSCARDSGCFQTLPENNPRCYNNWTVKEAEITLKCFSTKTEDICRGKYTLVNGSYSTDGEMTLAKRK